MEVHISNVPPRTNHTELRLFLRDTLLAVDILAFDIFKKVGNAWANLTLANESRGYMFLQRHGGPNPLQPLVFKKMRLALKRSNKSGQPDVLKIRVLTDKEATLRAKQSKNSMAVAKKTKTSKPIFPFFTFNTGIWTYDNLGRLIYDSKFRDHRQGTLTFGRSELVVYLAASIHPDYASHYRIDIPYSIINYAMPSDGNGTRGTVTLTLRTPPKIYRIESTDDLHLYTGREAPPEPTMPSLDQLSINKNAKKRLVRVCSLSDKFEKNSALCMVYRFVLVDIASAQRVWLSISQSSALSQAQEWRSMVPSRSGQAIEKEFDSLDRVLSYWSPDINVLSFDIRFQVYALVYEGYLAPKLALKLLEKICYFSSQYGADLTARGIRKLGFQVQTPGPEVAAENANVDYLARALEDIILKARDAEATTEDLSAKMGQHEHLVLTYKATVTPTGILLRGPDMNVSNRILRKYAHKSEYFMRVSFADEDGVSVLHDPRALQTTVYSRFKTVLTEGITLAKRTYSFLGFSHSSLRSHTAWFMAPFLQDGKILRAKDIIEDLGDFTHIHCSAKCAARIGQAFSDTIFAVPIPKNAFIVEDEPDIQRNGHCFSDGCGTMSWDLFERIWRRLPPQRRNLKPRILQVRYRGAKGVLSLDSSLHGEQLLVRKSMTKYTAREAWRDLEICGAAYKPLKMYLNHQFIKILEDLDIPRQNFHSVQKEALHQLELVIRHPINAASFLEYSYSGVAAKVPVLFTLMHQIGISFQEDRFLTDIIEVAAMSNLRDMKYRARIPIEKGYLLYGIMDETNELKEGEVYITTGYRDENDRWKQEHLIGTRVVVTRAPALHPGDIQVVRAVQVSSNSPLRDLYNCIVFSQQGRRDLPSMLGGGDLDGDLFHVIYDDRLVPRTTHPPSEYLPTEAQDLGRPVEVNDIVDFFIEYMNSDRLGQISNKHKIRADLHDEGTVHEDCIKLAKLASDAVDFSKSGNPVDMREVPRGTDHVRPDFMANGPGLVINKSGAPELADEDEDDPDDPDDISILDPDKFSIRYYRSDKILGELYRNIDEANFFTRMKRDFRSVQNAAFHGESLIQKLERYIDRETSIFQWQQHRGFAEELREYYSDNMFEIMDSLRPHRGKPLTELEVFSGNILSKKERASTRYIREANMEVRERFNRDVGAIIRRIVAGDGLDGDEFDGEGEALPRAIACFKVALETRGWEGYGGLKSWRYVAAAVCLEQLWKNMGFRLRPL